MIFFPGEPSKSLGKKENSEKKSLGVPCKKQRRKIHPKNSPKIKDSSEQVFLNNFHWVPVSVHREEGKSSRELFEQARVNAVLFLVFQYFGWVRGPLKRKKARNSQTAKKRKSG